MEVITLVLVPTRVDMLSLSGGRVGAPADDDNEAVVDSVEDLSPFSTSVPFLVLAIVLQSNLRIYFVPVSRWM